MSGKSTDQDSGTEVPVGSAATPQGAKGVDGKGADVSGDLKAAEAAPKEDTLSEDTGSDDTGSEDTGPVTNSAKEVFAAALEKKKAAGQARSAHLDGHGGVGGATASHKATRTFRRKSG